jgi:tetratricopeptide (TPR) repeat protein
MIDLRALARTALLPLLSLGCLLGATPIVSVHGPPDATRPAHAWRAARLDGDTQTSSRRPSAEDKALAAALQNADTQQQIVALRRFIAVYPKSKSIAWVRQRILEKVIEHKSGHQEVARAADEYVAALPRQDRPRGLRTVADMLLSAGLCPDVAEKAARDALVLLARPRGRAATPPSAEAREVAERARAFERGATLALLGSTLVERGDVAEAEKLLAEAYALDPGDYQRARISIALAGIDKRRGNRAAQFEHLTTAALSGALTEQATQDLDEAFRALHPEAPDRLEEWLDSRYRERYPNPIDVRLNPSPLPAARRTVLFELFTGAG